MKISFRVWILIIALLFSLLAIKPSFSSGVIVSSVEKDSPFFEQGLRAGEIIKSINNKEIKNLESYFAVASLIENEETRFEIQTDKGSYVSLVNQSLGISVKTKPKTSIQTGLDIRGGSRALVKPEGEITDDKLQELVDISRNRFNVYGLSDVNVRGINDFSIN